MKKHLFLAEWGGKRGPEDIKAGGEVWGKGIRHLNETVAGIAGYPRELE